MSSNIHQRLSVGKCMFAICVLAAAAVSAATTGPEQAVRDFIRALRLAVPGANIKVLFDGAPPHREPSGVLDAAAMEMPLVEIGTDEFYLIPGVARSSYHDA
jgi:hypothetical protein